MSLPDATSFDKNNQWVLLKRSTCLVVFYNNPGATQTFNNIHVKLNIFLFWHKMEFLFLFCIINIEINGHIFYIKRITVYFFNKK